MHSHSYKLVVRAVVPLARSLGDFGAPGQVVAARDVEAGTYSIRDVVLPLPGDQVRGPAAGFLFLSFFFLFFLFSFFFYFLFHNFSRV